MELVRAFCKINFVLKIKKPERFGLEKPLEIEFKNQKPVEMPKSVFEAYKKSYPDLYFLAGDEVSEDVKEPEINESETTEANNESDAVHIYTREELESVEREDLLNYVKELGIKNVNPNTGKEKLIEKILKFYEEEVNNESE